MPCSSTTPPPHRHSWLAQGPANDPELPTSLEMLCCKTLLSELGQEVSPFFGTGIGEYQENWANHNKGWSLHRPWSQIQEWEAVNTCIIRIRKILGWEKIKSRVWGSQPGEWEEKKNKWKEAKAQRIADLRKWQSIRVKIKKSSEFWKTALDPEQLSSSSTTGLPGLHLLWLNFGASLFSSLLAMVSTRPSGLCEYVFLGIIIA